MNSSDHAFNRSRPPALRPANEMTVDLTGVTGLVGHLRRCVSAVLSTSCRLRVSRASSRLSSAVGKAHCVEGQSKLREYAGVNRIGLCEHAGGFGEVPRLTGIDHGDRQLRRGEHCHHC